MTEESAPKSLKEIIISIQEGGDITETDLKEVLSFLDATKIGTKLVVPEISEDGQLMLGGIVAREMIGWLDSIISTAEEILRHLQVTSSGRIESDTN